MKTKKHATPCKLIPPLILSIVSKGDGKYFKLEFMKKEHLQYNLKAFLFLRLSLLFNIAAERN